MDSLLHGLWFHRRARGRGRGGGGAGVGEFAIRLCPRPTMTKLSTAKYIILCTGFGPLYSLLRLQPGARVRFKVIKLFVLIIRPSGTVPPKRCKTESCERSRMETLNTDDWELVLFLWRSRKSNRQPRTWAERNVVRNLFAAVHPPFSPNLQPHSPFSQPQP